ncbi:MAG: penicillin-binding protein 1C, partial [Halanaerobiaceae bacterium]
MNKKIAALSLIFTVVLLGGVGFAMRLPSPLFTDQYSTTVLDNDEQYLRIFLSDEEQWFFPPENKEIPEKLRQAVLTFEDKRFKYHPGVDPLAVCRAMVQNIRARGVVSGASTISMQVMRLSRPKDRTVLNKVQEMLQALNLELQYSKEDILQMYLNHAPYGGNIVGYRAASLRYFGREPRNLTWSEAALLAVMPNSPGTITPVRGGEHLQKKRNMLLDRMQEEGIIDAATCKMAKNEPLPDREYSFRSRAPILSRSLKNKTEDNIVRTTIDSGIQVKVRGIVEQQMRVLREKGIYNSAVVVAETGSGRVRAYIGSNDYHDLEHGGRVDGVQMKRSTGSILKPFLYGLAADEGFIVPDSLLEDIPTSYGGYSPSNADGEYRGLVTAREALVNSLNVPAVALLDEYGVRDFYSFLEDAGMETLFRSPGGYGLTLTLGGAEGRLWDIASMYQGLGNHGKFSGLHVIEGEGRGTPQQLISSGSSHLILEVLQDLSRPGPEYYWRQYASGKKIAWKTGTSYGNRDAWAAGVSPEWTIGVWTGNFDGHENDNISGLQSAAPLLFRVFNSLETEEDWFFEPFDDLREIEVSVETGYRLREPREEMRTVKASASAEPLRISPYEKTIFVNGEETREVCSLCWERGDVKKKTYTIYPPAVVDHLKERGKRYFLPPHSDDCPSRNADKPLEITYPDSGNLIMVPRGRDGNLQQVKFRAAHRRNDATLFWYLDDRYIGKTFGEHGKFLTPEAGSHRLYVIDDRGYRDQVQFHI